MKLTIGIGMLVANKLNKPFIDYNVTLRGNRHEVTDANDYKLHAFFITLASFNGIISEISREDLIISFSSLKRHTS